MTENKNNGMLIGIIIVLVVALLGLSFYMAYDKGLIFNSEKNNQEVGNNSENTQEEMEEITIDDSRFIEVYDRLKAYTYTTNRENGYSSFTNNDLSSIAIETLKSTDFVKTTEADSWGGYYLTLSGEVLTTNLKKYFTSSVIFDKNELVGKTIFWTSTELYNGNEVKVEHSKEFVSYDENLDVYKVREVGGIGGVPAPSANLNLRKIVSAKKNSDTIVVEEKVIYINSNNVDDNFTYKVYADSNKTKLLDTLIYNISTVTNQTIDVNNYLEDASTIMHTYKLNENTGNYYFVSSVIK